MSNINSYLRGDKAVLTVLVLALLAQTPHAQYVFFTQGHGTGWFAWVIAWGFAIALECAVLVFVMRGAKRASWGFAAYSIMINLSYYMEPSIGPTLLLSVGLPVAIALYSHEAAQSETHIDAHVISNESDSPFVAVVQNNKQIDASEDNHVEAMRAASAKVDDDARTLDELDEEILSHAMDAPMTAYAIAKATGKATTTMQRKDKNGEYTGRIPALVSAGYLREVDGAYIANELPAVAEPVLNGSH